MKTVSNPRILGKEAVITVFATQAANVLNIQISRRRIG